MTTPAVTLLLVDAAQVHEGKLSILGGCWTVLDEPSPHALVALVSFGTAGDIGNEYELVLRLVDATHSPVLGADADGALGPVRVSMPIIAPANAPYSAPVIPVVVGLMGLPLASSSTYSWVAELDTGQRITTEMTFHTSPNHPDLSVHS